MAQVFIVTDGNGESIYGVFSVRTLAEKSMARLNRVEILYNRNLHISCYTLDSREIEKDYLENYDLRENPSNDGD